MRVDGVFTPELRRRVVERCAEILELDTVPHVAPPDCDYSHRYPSDWERLLTPRHYAHYFRAWARQLVRTGRLPRILAPETAGSDGVENARSRGRITASLSRSSRHASPGRERTTPEEKNGHALVRLSARPACAVVGARMALRAKRWPLSSFPAGKVSVDQAWIVNKEGQKVVRITPGDSTSLFKQLRSLATTKTVTMFTR